MGLKHPDIKDIDLRENLENLDQRIEEVGAGSGGGGAVDSVNGATGVVVLDNTDVGAAATSHTHAQADVTNLTTDLAAKVPTSYLDTDGTLAADSDSKVATQKATKTYADTKATDTAVVHNTGTETVAGAKTFSSAAAFPAGSATAPGVSVRSSNIGIFSPGANLGGLAASNTELLRWQLAQVRLLTRLNVEKQLALPDTTTLYLSGTGDDYTVTSSDSAGIAVTTFAAGSNIYLPSTPTGVLYVIGLDPYATDLVTVASLYTLNPGEAAGFWYSTNLSNYMKIGA